MKVQAQEFSFKVDTHKSSRSRNDRQFHGDSVDRRLDRQQRANFRNLKVEISLRDWKDQD